MTLAVFIPGYITVPLAGLAMIVIAAHMVILERSGERGVRRRIRISNGWVMLINTPLIAAGFSLVDPSVRPRMFLIVWTTIIGLVAITLLLAAADIANTAAQSRRSLRDLRDARRAMLERTRADLASGAASGARSDD